MENRQIEHKLEILEKRINQLSGTAEQTTSLLQDIVKKVKTIDKHKKTS